MRLIKHVKTFQFFDKKCNYKDCKNERGIKNNIKSKVCDYHMCTYPICITERLLNCELCDYHKCKKCQNIAMRGEYCLDCYNNK